MSNLSTFWVGALYLNMVVRRSEFSLHNTPGQGNVTRLMIVWVFWTLCCSVVKGCRSRNIKYLKRGCNVNNYWKVNSYSIVYHLNDTRQILFVLLSVSSHTSSCVSMCEGILLYDSLWWWICKFLVYLDIFFFPPPFLPRSSCLSLCSRSFTFILFSISMSLAFLQFL